MCEAVKWAREEVQFMLGRVQGCGMERGDEGEHHWCRVRWMCDSVRDVWCGSVRMHEDIVQSREDRMYEAAAWLREGKQERKPPSSPASPLTFWGRHRES